MRTSSSSGSTSSRAGPANSSMSGAVRSCAPHRADEENCQDATLAPRADPELLPCQETAVQRCGRGPQQQGQTDHAKILRDRLNIHGAINLETGNTRMLEVVTALSTIMLLMAIETMYPGQRLIHVFLDNARYHHAKLVKRWLARPGCRIKLH